MTTINMKRVSRQGFGAMGLSHSYGHAEDQTSAETLRHAAHLGITLFDTATVYGDGHNETLVGSVLRNQRDSLVIASKFMHRRFNQLDAALLSPRAAVEASLARLGVEQIDLYYLHRVDREIPIEESVGELGRLKDEGKIGAVGISEATASEIRRAHDTTPITALQSEYSLWTREVEHEILPTVRELGIAFVAYSPLGRGFLAGSRIVDADDRRLRHPRFQPDAIAANSRRRAAIEAVAERHGATIAQISLAWLLSKDVHPIPGTRHSKHLEANWAANDLALDGQDISALEAAFPIGETVGARYPAEALAHVP